MVLYKVVEKDENISWEKIHEVILESHSENISKGINMRTTRLSGEELKERIGSGKCYVALDANNRVVATAAVSVKTSMYWFAKGQKVASFMLLSILPECRGVGIMKMLDEKRLEFVKQNNLDIITMDTAELNKKMIAIKLAHGYKKVSMFKSQYSRHYSIVLAKWISECPYSDSYIRKRYISKKIKIKVKTLIKSILNK